MKFQAIFLLFNLFMCNLALGRAPAVESFVGVEPETYRDIKKGNEFAYDFSGEPAPTKIEEVNPSSFFTLFALFAFACLPLIIWASMNFDIKNQEDLQTEVNVNNVSFVDFKSKNEKPEEHEIDKAS